MTEIEATELARAYVALSNAHRVDLIEPMFAGDAIYYSSAVGEYQGAESISEMMQAFFSRYPDVFWLAEDFHCASNRVSFNFSLQAIDTQSGSPLQRRGIEHIEFDTLGKIKRLEVHAS